MNPIAPITAITEILRKIGLVCPILPKKLSAMRQPSVSALCGRPNSPNDLQDLIRYVKEVGYQYVRLNTNIIQLTQASEYVQKFSWASLDIVFCNLAEQMIYYTKTAGPSTAGCQTAGRLQL